MYTVVLDRQPSGEVTVTPESDDPMVATVSGALTFSNIDTDPNAWNIPQQVTVTGAIDAVDNPGDERRTTITHAVSGGGYDSGGVVNLTVKVTDDDMAGITLSTIALALTEQEQPTNELLNPLWQSTYTVVLDTQPTGDVTVTPLSSALSVARVSGPLTFTPSNWMTPQTVTVTRVDDAIDNDPNRRATISHRVSGGGYGSVSAGEVAVTVLDNESLGVSLSATTVTVAAHRQRGGWGPCVGDDPDDR